MTVEQFLEDGRQLYKALETVAPYPATSYASEMRAMLPKALKALEVSCEALQNIDSPQRSVARAIADSRAALADVQAILEEKL